MFMVVLYSAVEVSHYSIAVQFFFVVVVFSNAHACLRSVMIRFFVFVNFSNVHVFCVPSCLVFLFVFSNAHVCFVLRYVQFFVFTNFVNVIQVLIMYLSLRVYLITFLSLSVVCLFFDALYFKFFCIFQF